MTFTPGPGSLWLSGAHSALPQDSTVVESPLPGGAAAVVRFLFNLPSWFQIGGFIVGVLVAAALAVFLWKRRQRIWGWVASRPPKLKWAVAGGAAAGVVVVAAAGAVSWNYMEHDNGFCTGCHIMENPVGRMTAARAVEQIEQKHDSLECHACHQQSIYASLRQLYLWVAERPEEIKPHAKVPTRICLECHSTDQKETWTRIATTAGHRTHLESDSTALKDVQCVTCHGLEVHRFVPVDSTCAQKGCHTDTKIALGKMAAQTDLHCGTCHQFTLEVPRLATFDSARGTLVPTNEQCFSCHAMRDLLAEFDPARDPHDGTCGACHDPHTQETPAAAKETCASAGCHDGWRDEPFHVGRAHRRAAEDCTACHEPHAARVDASDCVACHESVRARGVLPAPRLPPLPFDTTRALQQSMAEPDLRPERGKGDIPPPGEPPGGPAATFDQPSPSPSDTFSHDTHRDLACLTCHVSATGHGRLTFEPPRGCQICHHQAPTRSECAQCHDARQLAVARPVVVQVTVPAEPVRGREVGFSHPSHQAITCIECHSTPVSLAAADSVQSCAACHVQHHEPGRDCAACHRTGTIAEAHQRPVVAHQACDACHTPARVASFLPDRRFCLTCHEPADDHYAPKECTVCHFQASPAEYRAHLVRGSRPT